MTHPDTPCSRCGKLLYSGKGSLPAGERTCRSCRRARPKRQRPTRSLRPLCAEPGCSKRPVGNERCFAHRPEYAEYMRAHYRDQTHRRRRASVEQHTDITAEYERRLRVKAKRCPLCDVRLIDQPYAPASKELDHIIPLNVGGTHTIGNVRILCRTCNVRRPKDGSDYQGPVTLWAQAPAELIPQRAVRRPQVCECGARMRSGRCWTCQPSMLGSSGMAAEQVRERARRAAEMRDAGTRWQDIADALGFSGSGSAYLAAASARRRAGQAARHSPPRSAGDPATL